MASLALSSLAHLIGKLAHILAQMLVSRVGLLSGRVAQDWQLAHMLAFLALSSLAHIISTHISTNVGFTLWPFIWPWHTY